MEALECETQTLLQNQGPHFPSCWEHQLLISILVLRRQLVCPRLCSHLKVSDPRMSQCGGTKMRPPFLGSGNIFSAFLFQSSFRDGLRSQLHLQGSSNSSSSQSCFNLLQVLFLRTLFNEFPAWKSPSPSLFLKLNHRSDNRGPWLKMTKQGKNLQLTFKQWFKHRMHGSERTYLFKCTLWAKKCHKS
jgi:hypothetical protein